MKNRLIKDRYRLLSLLGRGGMGIVWLADDELLGRRIALKELVPSPHGESLSVQQERVLREARAAASIKHPGIVEIYDVFVEKDRPWIVMAYIKGRSLHDIIGRGRPGERRLASIGLRVLDALDAAHHVKVVHRDVKPANILISDEGEVFLVDFGIAQISGESRLTAQNGLTGTLDFMAPERIDGLTPEPPSDLWSLGVTFFYALEGYSPFRRDNVPATIRAIIDHAPPPTTRSGLLSEAVARLLHKNPARRMDAPELTLVLESIVNGSPHRSTSPLPGRSASPPPRRTMESAPANPVNLGTLDLSESVRLISGMAAVLAAQSLAGLSPAAAQEILIRLKPEAAGAILLALPQDGTASILAVVPVKIAGALLDVMATRPREAAAVLQMLSAVRAGRALNYMNSGEAAALLGTMTPSEAARILVHTDVLAAAGIVDALAVTSMAIRLIETMSVRRACGVLGRVPPVIIAGLLKASSDGRADLLLDGLDPPVRVQVLRHLNGS